MVTAIAAQHETVRVATCPSNHAAWRQGRDYLGRPGDDFGIDCHLSVRDVLARDPRSHYAQLLSAGKEELEEVLA